MANYNDSTIKTLSATSISMVALTLFAVTSVLLVSADIALCQEVVPQAQPPQPTASGMLARMGIMFVIVYAIFHFLVIKPQKAKLVEQQSLLKDLKKGEQVVTTGGMIGRVAGVESDHVSVEIAPNVKVKFEFSAISKKLEKDKQAA